MLCVIKIYTYLLVAKKSVSFFFPAKIDFSRDEVAGVGKGVGGEINFFLRELNLVFFNNWSWG